MKYPSRVGEALELISEAITSTETFKDTPIFYDFIEVDANNLPPSCIVFKPLEWEMDNSCNYGRQVDIVMVITTEERREGVVGQLFMFGEKLRDIIDELALTVPFELRFLQGSPVQGFAYNRESVDSYKETKQLFTSIAVLSYFVRY